jgi:hypothetical protein
MKISRALPLLLLLTASAAHAQNPSPGVKNLSSVPVQQTPARAIWLKAEVVQADRNSIVVREESNPLAIHTFTYGPGLKDRMEAIADQGGFQSGDKIRVLYKLGQTVALKIHGKPSKVS